MTRGISTVVALTAVYALALASADPWDVALGAIFGAGITFAFRRFLFVSAPLSLTEAFRRAVHLPKLLFATAVNIVRGTVAVVRLSLGPLPPTGVGFVTIPDGERTASGVIVSGLLDTLSPGSVFIEQDAQARTWTIHAIDASDEEATAETLQRFYKQFQRPVWP